MIVLSYELTSIILSVCLLLTKTTAFYDMGSTTASDDWADELPRESFFRWQKVEWGGIWTGWIDWEDMYQRRRLCHVAGLSIDFTTLGVATILNRRTLITSDNIVDAHMHRQRDLRIWALGRHGAYNTPYRYRVWKVTRVFPRSLNPEHWHGPRGIHQPRHDIAIVHSHDQMYLYYYYPARYMYPYRAVLVGKHEELMEDLWMAGSGFERMKHVLENYKIVFAYQKKSNVVDCSKYLPKYWGKFICLKNYKRLTGVSAGGGLFMLNKLVGIGCFEIRYNEDRILVFTDLRYYVDWINVKAAIKPGEYYEYAYPQWGIWEGNIYDNHNNYPRIPLNQIHADLFPLGKKK